ncbi:methyltransferase domain-containing protein [Halomicroarcula sp. S1AR25-4]|uniref:class I SAM-dependent methyltransferase n=1 Tax=Haloarcula sp. S1AR25-4 TaxID=2950538 RepID=UPI002876984F|nr:methyltransferase domain-containing protein [Halomicroarcula sp. S1AR25-4]MDS0277627.1 methyltransferase domain-containing protein [Halomicroarcula sp. S1AR25-4]
MWADSREALADLDLQDCDRVLDVGCGTGELTRVLREETDGTVVGLDADAALLESVPGPVAQGDATRLPFAEDAFDLVVCQALLINLPDPEAAVREFARVASGRVAAVEPDNGAVTVESTVDSEPRLARRARRYFLDGVRTDVTLGAGAADVFDAAGLDVVSTRRYDQHRTVEPPYDEAAVRAARRKATGEGLATDRATILGGETTPEEYDALRQRWREMGRTVVAQMQDEAYERRETVPFFVTVGRV